MIKNPHASAGDMGWISGLGRFPGEGNGNPLQYSCLENRMDRGAWWATVHEVSKSWTQLSAGTHVMVKSSPSITCVVDHVRNNINCHEV